MKLPRLKVLCIKYNVLCILGILLFTLTTYYLLLTTVSAQDVSSLGIANYYAISDSNVKDGDIVSFSAKGYFLSKIPYDTAAFGVVTNNAAISLTSEDNEGKYPVVSTGNVLLNVSAKNGSIQKGDLITTSEIAGVGVKALKSGVVIGTAADSFSSNNPEETGKILATLNVHYFYSTNDAVKRKVLDIAALSALAITESPSAVFKQVVAATVVIISFVLGFVSFGRIAKNGVEALGRNPMAGYLIQFGIFLNVIITVAIILAGLGVAFLILSL